MTNSSQFVNLSICHLQMSFLFSELLEHLKVCSDTDVALGKKKAHTQPHHMVQIILHNAVSNKDKSKGYSLVISFFSSSRSTSRMRKRRKMRRRSRRFYLQTGLKEGELGSRGFWLRRELKRGRAKIKSDDSQTVRCRYSSTVDKAAT